MSKKKIMAICDTEAGYACRLMEFLEEKRRLPYEIHAFTSAEKLCAYAEKEELEILLVSEEVGRERICALPARYRIVLTDGETGESEEELRIDRFQQASRILEQMLSYSMGNAVPVRTELPAGDRGILGIYAPAGGSEATVFALGLGLALAEEREVLYISLQNYSGLGRLTEQMPTRTLGDLLYYYRRQTENLAERAGEIVRWIDGLAFLPPTDAPTDLQEITGEEWCDLLARLLREAPYERIVLELSDGVRDLPEVLGICSRIFLATGEDLVAREAAEQFLESLRDSGRRDLLARCVQVRPVPVTGRTTEDLLQEISEGCAGEYARRCLKEGTAHGIAAGDEEPSAGRTRRKRRAFRRRDPDTNR